MEHADYSDNNEIVPSSEDTSHVGRARYDVWFGTAFSVDKFGFVRGGRIELRPDSVELSGNRHWSFGARLAMFLAITILPALLIRFGLGFLVALVVVHYFCASPGAAVILKSSIGDVRRSTRVIRFAGSSPDGAELRESVFKASTEADAKEIEAALTSIGVSR